MFFPSNQASDSSEAGNALFRNIFFLVQATFLAQLIIAGNGAIAFDCFAESEKTVTAGFRGYLDSNSVAVSIHCAPAESSGADLILPMRIKNGDFPYRLDVEKWKINPGAITGVVLFDKNGGFGENGLKSESPAPAQIAIAGTARGGLAWGRCNSSDEKVLLEPLREISLPSPNVTSLSGHKDLLAVSMAGGGIALLRISSEPMDLKLLWTAGLAQGLGSLNTVSVRLIMGEDGDDRSNDGALSDDGRNINDATGNSDCNSVCEKKISIFANLRDGRLFRAEFFRAGDGIISMTGDSEPLFHENAMKVTLPDIGFCPQLFHPHGDRGMLIMDYVGDQFLLTSCGFSPSNFPRIPANATPLDGLGGYFPMSGSFESSVFSGVDQPAVEAIFAAPWKVFGSNFRNNSAEVLTGSMTRFPGMLRVGGENWLMTGHWQFLNPLSGECADFGRGFSAAVLPEAITLIQQNEFFAVGHVRGVELFRIDGKDIRNGLSPVSSVKTSDSVTSCVLIQEPGAIRCCYVAGKLIYTFRVPLPARNNGVSENPRINVFQADTPMSDLESPIYLKPSALGGLIVLAGSSARLYLRKTEDIADGPVLWKLKASVEADSDLSVVASSAAISMERMWILFRGDRHCRICSIALEYPDSGER
ncbi:MAG: hypothetical protein CVV64_11120 [Candidatus Wallbacteria bacterium HGW-Wallbacteria-1]|uniref:Uncharacterized protein n=1 Tax=Candidatus Wallbacteria bacterium HGW-Wallbacteria-1 TaxID=2013854 RepID=A0A2N1PP59_9BACT|nr:MAG: hypothetical protein CVV64_11120 [Candidatus Wallbacteria bacterium HGW-Wallbacteria-1]